jgi:hypothetical protein
MRIAPASSRAALRASAAPGPVGLVHRDDVGDLEDAALDPLQLVAGAGQRQEQERVDHLGDGDLRLPDPDRLDQDDVVPGRLDDDHRLPRGLRDPAERARGRRRPDERVRVDRQPRHPGLVTEDRPAGPCGRRVDGEHRHPRPGRGERHPELVDEGRLPHPGDAADADPPRRPGVRQQLHQQLLGALPVVGAVRLHQRDRPRHGPPVTGQHALDQRRDVDGTAHYSFAPAACSAPRSL